MAHETSDEETNYWPGFVDALSTMTMMLIFLMMILSLVLVSVSQNVSKAQVVAIARAAKIDISGQSASIESLTTQVIAALSRMTDNENPRQPFPETTIERPASPKEPSASIVPGQRPNVSIDQGERKVAKGEFVTVKVDASPSKVDNGRPPNTDVKLPPTSNAAVADRNANPLEQGNESFKQGQTENLKAEAVKTAEATPSPPAETKNQPAAVKVISDKPNLSVDQGNKTFSKGEATDIRYNVNTPRPDEPRENPAAVPPNPEAKGFVAERPKLGVATGDKTVSEGLPDTNVSNGKSSNPSVAQKQDSSPVPVSNPPKSSQIASLEPQAGQATFAEARPSPEETRIVSLHQADIDPFGGGVDVQTDKPMLTMVYEPRAVRLDGDATLKVKDFLEQHKDELAARRVRIRALANVRDGAVTDARRFGYYRAMAMRQLLIDLGYPAPKIVLTIDDVSDSERTDTLELFAIKNEN